MIIRRVFKILSTTIIRILFLIIMSHRKIKNRDNNQKINNNSHSNKLCIQKIKNIMFKEEVQIHIKIKKREKII
jgi:hypothetical protein